MKTLTRIGSLGTILLALWPLAAAAQPVLLRGTVVTMEAEEDVITTGAVLVDGGEIVEILTGNGPSPVPGAIEIETDGLIFPGLINIHDHEQWAPLRPLTVDTLYDNRYQWQPDGNGVNLTPFIGVNPPLAFNQGSSPFNADGLYPGHLLNDSVLAGLAVEAAKWGEIQALVGGTTTTEGSRPLPGVVDILLRNAEHTNFGQDRVCRSVEAVGDPAFATFAADVLAQAGAGQIDACLIHLAEGVDAASLAELDQLEALGMLQPWTVIVHGVPFGPAEFARMAAAGADLVWSPTSNLRLYGQDARADLALAAGVNTSLSTDWTLSGDPNLLASLKVAWDLNQARHQARKSFSPAYERFSAFELVEMVTVNPARSLGWESRTGRLREGLAADLLVISASPSAKNMPYDALIAAGEAD
ncbi:MAG: amidohydrolase family protein, partial [Thermoanaerobaculia bacterium]|nr:amidohydrolase family protein [Thermoanaerobaculia bacterium]